MAVASPDAQIERAEPRKMPSHSDLLSGKEGSQLVDQMLVLLILLMLATPMILTNAPASKPAVVPAALSNVQALNQQDAAIAVTIDGTGQYFVDQVAVASENLVSVLGQKSDGKARIQLRSGEAIAQNKMIEIIDLLHAAGFRVDILPELSHPQG